MIDLYEAQHAGLVAVHGSISQALERLVTAAPNEPWLLEHATGTGQFVLFHHHAEDSVLFPSLRELSRPGTFEAFLTERDREHRALHVIAERLAAATTGDDAIALGRALVAELKPHLAEEEAGLSANGLRRMLDERALGILTARLDALRAGR